MAQRLFTAHPRALAVLLADLEGYALHQPEVFVGTAGSVGERSKADGYRFYSHQFYDGDGKKEAVDVGQATRSIDLPCRPPRSVAGRDLPDCASARAEGPRDGSTLPGVSPR